MKNIAMVFQNIKSTQHNKKSVAMLVFLSLAFYLLRLPNLAYIENTLIGEDGPIFFNFAYQKGISSLFITYGGYLHLYPRICALLASLISIRFTPYLYFFASLIPPIFLAYAVAKRLEENKVCFINIFLAILFIFIQPSSGEVFYNITNSQWFIGTAIAIWILLSNDSKSSIFELIIITIGLLTGPFAILMIPGITLKLIYEKKARSNISLYSIVFICAAIQLSLMLISQRGISTPTDKNIYNWIYQLFIYLSFGLWSIKKILLLALAPLWLILFWHIFIFRNNPNHFKSALLLLTAIIWFVAALIAVRNAPSLLHPYIYKILTADTRLSGSRYYFSSYTLVIVCLFMQIAESTYKRILVCLSLAIPCFLAFKKMDKTDMHWMAYFAFAEKIPGISIPLYSPYLFYPPPWHADIPKKLIPPHKSNEVTTVPLYAAKTLNLHAIAPSRYHPTESNSSLFYPVPPLCKARKYLGFKAEIEKSTPGVVKFFWKGNLDYSERRMNSQFFNAGKTPIFFAIPTANVEELRLEFMNEKLPYSVLHSKILCTN